MFNGIFGIEQHNILMHCMLIIHFKSLSRNIIFEYFHAFAWKWKWKRKLSRCAEDVAGGGHNDIVTKHIKLNELWQTSLFLVIYIRLSILEFFCLSIGAHEMRIWQIFPLSRCTLFISFRCWRSICTNTYIRQCYVMHRKCNGSCETEPVTIYTYVAYTYVY